MTFDASTSDGLIRLYKNLEVVNGIKFGKIQYWDFGDGGILGWVLGTMNGVMYALIAFVVIDYITGVIAAAVQKRLNSKDDAFETHYRELSKRGVPLGAY